MSGSGHVYYPFAATSYGDSHGYTHEKGSSITSYRERYVNQDHRGSAHLTTLPIRKEETTTYQPSYTKQERVITPEKTSYSPMSARPHSSYQPSKPTNFESFEYTPSSLNLSLHEYPQNDRIYTQQQQQQQQPQYIFQSSAPLKTLSDDALHQTIQRPMAHTARSTIRPSTSGFTSTYIHRPPLNPHAHEASTNYCKQSLSRRVNEQDMKFGQLPGYMGFVRSFQFKHGSTFGKTSREIMNEQPIRRA